LLGYFGWPVLRGDVSTQSPLTRRDSVEEQGNLDPSKRERPSGKFLFGLAGLGIVALAAGIILILR
jgi:hypothetical protein